MAQRKSIRLAGTWTEREVNLDLCRRELYRHLRQYYGSRRLHNKVIETIMELGKHDRRTAESLFNALWRLNDKNPDKVAAVIADL